MKPIHHLTQTERAALAEANRLLTELTEQHCHSCECELCLARPLTDVQYESAFHVPYTPVVADETPVNPFLAMRAAMRNSFLS